MKHQAEYANELTALWMKGDFSQVRTLLRNGNNQAQAIYLTAAVCASLPEAERGKFVEAMDIGEGA